MLNESDMEAAAPASAHNPLEQFVLLAKTAKGAACAELIRQVLEAPGVYVFGELLAMPNVLELETTTDYAAHLHTLRLFAYGTYTQYSANRSQLLPLSPAALRKLQHLTIVSMAVSSKLLAYDALLPALGCQTVRQLEDVCIEAIYADVLHGRLDQRKRLLEVDFAIGRDIRDVEDVAVIKRALQEWSRSCETVLQCVEAQIGRANDKKSAVLRSQKDIEAEIAGIKQTLRSQPADDEAMAAECVEGRGGGGVKRGGPKVKVLKAAAKASN